MLAAEVRAAPLHLLVDIAVADLCLDDLDAPAFSRLVEAEFGHQPSSPRSSP